MRQYSWARSSWRTCGDVLDVVDAQEHDRQVAGDGERPQLRLRPRAPRDRRARRAPRAGRHRGSVPPGAGNPPPPPRRHRDGAAGPAPASTPACVARSKAVAVVMLVDQVDQRLPRAQPRLSRRRRARPCRARSCTRWRSAKTGSRTVPDRVRQGRRPSRRATRRSLPRPRNRARSVSYSGSPTTVALDDGEMRGPDRAARPVNAAGASRSARRIRADIRSARTAWRTPDARRRPPASSAPVRRRR